MCSLNKHLMIHSDLLSSTTRRTEDNDHKYNGMTRGSGLQARCEILVALGYAEEPGEATWWEALGDLTEQLPGDDEGEERFWSKLR